MVLGYDCLKEGLEAWRLFRQAATDVQKLVCVASLRRVDNGPWWQRVKVKADFLPSSFCRTHGL